MICTTVSRRRAACYRHNHSVYTADSIKSQTQSPFCLTSFKSVDMRHFSNIYKLSNTLFPPYNLISLWTFKNQYNIIITFIHTFVTLLVELKHYILILFTRAREFDERPLLPRHFFSEYSLFSSSSYRHHYKEISSLCCVRILALGWWGGE